MRRIDYDTEHCQGGSGMSSGQLYDTIGATYTVTRRTEPRIAARVSAALGDARTVLNVGAGTGSYEPPDRHVPAVEPSAVMRAQRPAGRGDVRGCGREASRSRTKSFDAAIAFATIHHWQDPIAGLREECGTSLAAVVVLTHNASSPHRFWLDPRLPARAPTTSRPAFPDEAGPRDRSGACQTH